MLGDAAVAVHPEDPRYKNLIGQFIDLPLANRRIPIIADDHCDPEFGTGCVKITPAHDFNDYEVGKRHQLPLINIFDKNAAVLPQAHEEFKGLDRFQARKAIIKSLNALQLLEKIEDHALKIPKGDRSGTIIEPWLTDQWYVATKPLAEPAINVVEQGKIQFIPQQYENMYFSWMRNIQDWCISRQLWWGHRIPAWYDDSGNVYVERNEDAVRKKYNLGDIPLQQDNDVLDTWFSSGLWTFSTLGWPEQTERLKTFHPTDVLVTGFDIIFFWVARMIMLTLHLTKDEKGASQVPFKTVYVHGLVRDGQGQKMSKSKGNVLDPLDLIDGIELDQLIKKRTKGMMQPKLADKIVRQTKAEFPAGINAYGTDALRFTNCSLASTGRDIKFDMGRIEGYRNFCNKLWNAAHFVIDNTEQYTNNTDHELVELSAVDQWIISELQRTISSITHHLDNFRFDLASQALYEFVWDEYCAWYLELVKPVLWDENASLERQHGTQQTLVCVLEVILRLAHPFMPFITEEIWQKIKKTADVAGETIMLQAWPEESKNLINQTAEDDISWIKSFMLGIRQIRGEMNIAMSKQLNVLLKNASDLDQKRASDYAPLLKKLAKIASIDNATPKEVLPLSATALIGDMELLVPMAGLINKEAELARLDKEIKRLSSEADRIIQKLSNSNFVDKAPAAVIEKEHKKRDQATHAIEKLKEQYQNISDI
ncbi:UNVERIFIED_CONTAM: hypothetical protein GTU68_062066 [Idotea baltica]|nr:hypothetical protein [Idotea baltica]